MGGAGTSQSLGTCRLIAQNSWMNRVGQCRGGAFHFAAHHMLVHIVQRCVLSESAQLFVLAACRHSAKAPRQVACLLA